MPTDKEGIQTSLALKQTAQGAGLISQEVLQSILEVRQAEQDAVQTGTVASQTGDEIFQSGPEWNGQHRSGQQRVGTVCAARLC